MVENGTDGNDCPDADGCVGVNHAEFHFLFHDPLGISRGLPVRGLAGFLAVALEEGVEGRELGEVAVALGFLIEPDLEIDVSLRLAERFEVPLDFRAVSAEEGKARIDGARPGDPHEVADRRERHAGIAEASNKRKRGQVLLGERAPIALAAQPGKEPEPVVIAQCVGRES